MMPRGIGELSAELKYYLGSPKGRIMWWLSFLAIIWALWKERISRCFEGVSSHVDVVVERVRFSVAPWISIKPSFNGLSLDMTMLNWKEVANS